MEKVVFVKAHFRPRYKQVTVQVPTGETKKGLFGGEKQVMRKEVQRQETSELSDREIDGEMLAQDLQSAIDALNAEGFSVKTLTAVVSGAYDHKVSAEPVASKTEWHQVQVIGPANTSSRFPVEKISGGGSYGYGYGYSYTDGLIIVASK